MQLVERIGLGMGARESGHMPYEQTRFRVSFDDAVYVCITYSLREHA